MQHSNPLAVQDGTSARFITIGEIMLRLTPPNYEKIRMATSFEASYGGSEANIALALANLGVDSTFSRSSRTTASAKARSACSAATTSTARR